MGCRLYGWTPERFPRGKTCLRPRSSSRTLRGPSAPKRPTFFMEQGRARPICWRRILARFPGLKIAGTLSPPFRALDMQESTAFEKRIQELRPHFVWVGLSTPKQEKFMAEFSPRLGNTVMLGVGAAFDFLAGRVKQAPRWIQHSGFEWAFRLCAEPRRLAPRYLKNNPLFMLRAFAQLTHSSAIRSKTSLTRGAAKKERNADAPPQTTHACPSSTDAPFSNRRQDNGYVPGDVRTRSSLAGPRAIARRRGKRCPSLRTAGHK